MQREYDGSSTTVPFALEFPSLPQYDGPFSVLKLDCCNFRPTSANTKSSLLYLSQTQAARWFGGFPLSMASLSSEFLTMPISCLLLIFVFVLFLSLPGFLLRCTSYPLIRALGLDVWSTINPLPLVSFVSCGW